ncbi:MAG: OmpA family protein, partial [Sphingobacteriales bacterium]
DKLSEPLKTSARISIWRQNTRVRVYMDDKKVWDMPKALPEGMKLNSLYFRNNAASNDEDAYYIGNVRLAVGAPDTRNKLITEGKFVTHGILFDVNSDKIKPESYGAIKDIANVLTENSSVNVLIVGHTDSDGDDAGNMELSKKRALAVKNILSKEFNVNASRLTTDGKGELQPIDKNTSSLGKANNRRVEFIKQ